ncbi:MAG TPA: serine acetyltransferase [Dehalococcoidia bacterium]
MSYLEEDARVYAQYHFLLFEKDWDERPWWNRLWLGIDLAWRSQSFSAVVLYRLAGWCRRRRLPFLPTYLDKLLMGTQNVFIGGHVEIGPGLYIAHGNVVIDGVVRIGARCVVNPWVTIGLRGRPRTPDRFVYGPTLGDDVYIGTGAMILGDIRVGDGAVIAANAVVIEDVPPYHVAVGAPARALPRRDLTPEELAALAGGEPPGR